MEIIEKTFLMPITTFSDTVAFHGTIDEQLDADIEETRCENAWKELIENPNLLALSFKDRRWEKGDTLILSPSLREGKWQLSYINWDNVPGMDEQYGGKAYMTEEKLYRSLTHYCHNVVLPVKALFAA